MSMDYATIYSPAPGDVPEDTYRPIDYKPGYPIDAGPRGIGGRRGRPIYTIMPVRSTADGSGMTTQPAPLDSTGATGPPATAGGAAPGTAPASSGGIGDALGGILSGSIMGIPTLYIVGGLAAYFLFFKKR